MSDEPKKRTISRAYLLGCTIQSIVIGAVFGFVAASKIWRMAGKSHDDEFFVGLLGAPVGAIISLLAFAMIIRGLFVNNRRLP